MPVHEKFKLLKTEKQFADDSEHAGNMQISVDNLVNLETNHNTDTSRSSNSLEKSQVGCLDFELSTSSTQCELGVGKHLRERCSASHAKCGVSHGQCHEVRSKINYSDSKDSLAAVCQRNTEVFLKQQTSKGSKSASAPSLNLLRSSTAEIAKLPINKLRTIAEDLAQTVEEVSSELVSLLLENDALQQESDARNIAIEQLLKLTWKQTENELRPVQMSVILPSDNCDSDID